MSVSTQRSPNVEPMPGPAALAGLQAFIESIVDARLRAAGATAATPDPRALRIAKGLSIVELAQRAGISHPALSRIESGRTRRPSAATLDAIARALGCSEQTYRSAFAAMLQRGRPVND